MITGTEQRIWRKVDGIIGYSFSAAILALSISTAIIEVYKPGSFQLPERRNTAHPAFTNLPIQWLG